jgi:flagellar motor switch protein FliM
MPYSMLEPIREILDSGVQSDVEETDERWINALREEIEQATVTLSGRLLETELALRDMLNLKAGDVIPVETPKMATVCAEGVPVLRGQFGTTNGKNAIKVVKQVHYPKRELRDIGEEVNDGR